MTMLFHKPEQIYNDIDENKMVEDDIVNGVYIEATPDYPDLDNVRRMNIACIGNARAPVETSTEEHYSYISESNFRQPKNLEGREQKSW